jgi:hypothetical protein
MEVKTMKTRYDKAEKDPVKSVGWESKAPYVTDPRPGPEVSELQRKLADIAKAGPITWEVLDDYGLFGLFKRLPSPDEVRALIRDKER